MTHAQPQAALDLYWIPLGAGASVVRASGRLYEAFLAALQRRPRCQLYHSALIASLDGVRTTIEMTPTPDDQGSSLRGVVAVGAVGSTLLGRSRLFRYEVRRWTGGVIPDLGYANGNPVRLTHQSAEIRRALAMLECVPTPVWGRDELRTGEMWNSNSVVAWLLATCDLLDAAGDRPTGGRAPGWDAGVTVARRGLDRDRQPKSVGAGASGGG